MVARGQIQTPREDWVRYPTQQVKRALTRGIAVLSRQYRIFTALLWDIFRSTIHLFLQNKKIYFLLSAFVVSL